MIVENIYKHKTLDHLIIVGFRRDDLIWYKKWQIPSLDLLSLIDEPILPCFIKNSRGGCGYGFVIENQ